MRILTDENYNYYEKAVRRLKKCGILDPTNVIAELEKEIDQYRYKIRCYEEDSRKKHKESYIKNVLGKSVINSGLVTGESEDFLYVTTTYEESKYSKLQLAIFWLEHSNDCFYETFGFNWVPDSKLQEKAREAINHNTEVVNKISNMSINIDFADSLRYSIESVTKYMANKD